MKNFKIIVAGATGNIGNIIFEDLKKDFKVFGLSKKNNIDNQIYSLNHLKNNFGNFDILINAAGINPGKYSKLTEKEVYKKNIDLNNKIISLIKLKKIKKVIFLSSFSVYVLQRYINEHTQLNINSFYSKSKIDFERKVFKLNISSYCLRLSAVLSRNSKYNWLSEIKNKIIKNKNLLFYNQHNIYNNCLDVKDLLKTIKKLIQSNYKKKAIYNLASNGSVRIKDIINIINKMKFYKKRIVIKKKNSLKCFYNNSQKIQQDLKLKFRSTKKVLENFFNFNNKKNLILIGAKGNIGSNFYKLKKNFFNIMRINKDNFNKILKKKIFNKYNNATIIFLAYNKRGNIIKTNTLILRKLIKNLDINKIDKFFYISSLYSHDNNYKQMHKIREKILRIFLKKKLFLLYPGKIYGGINYSRNKINKNYGINSFINNLKQRKIIIYGNGANYCPHIYINDFIEQLFLLITKDYKNGKYYLYPKDKISFIKLANMIMKISKLKNLIIFKKGNEKKYKYVKPFEFPVNLFKYSNLNENLNKILNS
jgi:nucleoside-diphosphate-sugar epimerase